MQRRSTVLRIGMLSFLSFVVTSTLYAQERGNDKPRVSPNASVSQAIGTTVVSITYGRPAVKGREIFGGLVKYGEVWRAGANECTVITFSRDVKIEGKELKAGAYSLYTLPGEEEWTVIFNSKLSWGTQYDGSKDVLRVTVKPKEGQAMEWMTFSFDPLTSTSAVLNLQWDKTIIPINIQS